ncbi:MAG: hypothetical protein NTY34_02260 [Candidatus Omnitrophica bacterium]|nr:hypothetical protein [Candidatus Omnitrophota bacterium]
MGLIFLQSGAEQVFVSNRGFEWSAQFVIKKIIGLFIQFGGGVQYSFMTVKQAAMLIKKAYLVFFIAPVIFLFYSNNKKYLKLFLIPLAILLVFYPIRLNARYLPFCAVSYIILIASGFRLMTQRKPVLANVIMAAFIIVNLSSLAWLFKVNYDPYHREDYIGAAKYIKENIGPSDGLIGSREQIRYYLKRDYAEDGEVIWEALLGNPDPAINDRLMAAQAKRLNRKITSMKQFGDLVWVIKYAK